MENFIVSARKYRPVTFDTVVGQPSITNTLKNAIRNHHLAQAFLFTGPRGVGKTTTARILAKTINCANMSEAVEACNQCDSCIAFNNGNSFNIYELDAASNNSVDDIRALVEQVRYPPQGGKYKVYIIDEVHMLSPSAFNAFLKTLEEPPAYAVFILATTEKHKIIPTILSRCQIFDFNRISVEDIARHLGEIAGKEKVQAEEDALHMIAQKADGALRDALSMFDQLVSFAGNNLTYKAVIENLNILDYDYYFKMTDDILEGNISSALLTFNEILNNGFDAHNFVNGLASHFRDVLVCKDESTLKLLEVSPNIREKYKIQSRQCTASLLLDLLDISSKCDISYKAAKNQRLHVELALLKMCSLKSSGSVADPFKKKVDTAVSQPVPASTPPVIAKQAIPEASVVKEPDIPVEPAKTKAPAPSSVRKTISITENLNSKSNPKPEAKKKEEPAEEVKNRPFTQPELETAWSDFTNRVHQLGRLSLHASLIKRKPELKDNFMISFVLDNPAVEKDINEIKMELMAFLRKELGNSQIQFSTVIEKNSLSSEKVPYTSKEKYEHMAAKNPALNELRKQLDLDIDY
ncbi:MAG: DNA polymerase III subunit gamma/tau [Bacteroidetes bacterium]|nr:DNA polymerase III subunit gamma/tau [Bacteroidota bacterium]